MDRKNLIYRLFPLLPAGLVVADKMISAPEVRTSASVTWVVETLPNEGVDVITVPVPVLLCTTDGFWYVPYPAFAYESVYVPNGTSANKNFPSESVTDETAGVRPTTETVIPDLSEGVVPSSYKFTEPLILARVATMGSLSLLHEDRPIKINNPSNRI